MAINKKSENQNNIISSQIANMQSMEKRVKKLTTRLWAGIFLLFIMLLSGILLFYYEQLALALTGNYTMTSGDLLTAGDWNTLAADFEVPAGAVMAFNLEACPLGWILADGTSGTPDLRGAFIRGMYGNQNGRDDNRSLGSYQGDRIIAHGHYIDTLYDGGAPAFPYSLVGDDGSWNGVDTNGVWTDTSSNVARTKDINGNNSVSENRVKNIALTYCMKN